MAWTENASIEFKREYTPDVKNEIVAFANSNGGAVYIGVGDNGEAVGLSEPDKVLLQVTSMLRDAIRPDISMFTQGEIQIKEGKSVVAVSVQRGTGRPYYIAEKGLKPSGVYVRLGSASVPASEDAIRAMIKETDGDSFEAARSLNQELSFDSAKAEFERRGIEFGATQMRNLGIVGGDGLFTNLGLLLSDQCVHTIKTAVFEGIDKSVFKDRREYSGSLLKQLSNVYEYIDLHNKTHAKIEGLLRVDNRDYPEVAIRETLLNALVHRDYSFSGSTLISIFDNRIEVVSLGGLVPGLSQAAIKIGASQSRNEKLAGVFYGLKLIEAYGTGIAKIVDSYAGMPVRPDFVVTDGAFLTRLPNRNESDGNNSPGIPVGTNMQKVLDYICDRKEVSRRDIEVLLGIGQTAAGNLLKSLERDAKITAVGRGKNVRYVVREDNHL